MNPLVSCIVPTYNGERFLAEALDSILAQTYGPIEIVLVDDGSTDNTRAIVDSYGERVQYIYKEHTGIPATCNLGLRAAQGEFISFLDADDLWVPEKTEIQMNLLAAKPETGACVAMIQNFWMPELREEEIAMQNHRHSKPIEGYALQSLLARRRTFEIVGSFDESFHHASKTVWFLEAERLKIHIELLPDVLSLRRMHLDNFSRQNAGRSQMEYLRALKKYRSVVRNVPE